MLLIIRILKISKKNFTEINFLFFIKREAIFFEVGECFCVQQLKKEFCEV